MDWTERSDGTHTTPDGRYLLATRRDDRPRYARSYWVLIDTRHPDEPDHQVGGPLAGHARLEAAKYEAERRISMAQCPDHDDENPNYAAEPAGDAR